MLVLRTKFRACHEVHRVHTWQCKYILSTCMCMQTEQTTNKVTWNCWLVMVGQPWSWGHLGFRDASPLLSFFFFIWFCTSTDILSAEVVKLQGQSFWHIPPHHVIASSHKQMGTLWGVCTLSNRKVFTECLSGYGGQSSDTSHVSRESIPHSSESFIRSFFLTATII